MSQYLSVAKNRNKFDLNSKEKKLLQKFGDFGNNNLKRTWGNLVNMLFLWSTV
jgi:hypothetical protein